MIRCQADFADSGEYFVSIENSCGRIDSVSAVIDVLPDTTPPALVSVRFNCSNQVDVTFSQPVELSGTYSLDGAFVSGMAYLGDQRTIRLSIDSLQPGATYHLTVSDVSDLCAGNILAPNPVEIVFTVPMVIITRQPASVIVSNCCTNACFSVTAVSTGGCAATLTYQ